MIKVNEAKVEFEGNVPTLIAEIVGAVSQVVKVAAKDGGITEDKVLNTIWRGITANRLMRSGMTLEEVKEILK